MLSILANGTLITDPVERRSVNDGYATCTMRVPCEDDSEDADAGPSVEEATELFEYISRGLACESL